MEVGWLGRSLSDQTTAAAGRNTTSLGGSLLVAVRSLLLSSSGHIVARSARNVVGVDSIRPSNPPIPVLTLAGQLSNEDLQNHGKRSNVRTAISIYPNRKEERNFLPAPPPLHVCFKSTEESIHWIEERRTTAWTALRRTVLSEEQDAMMGSTGLKTTSLTLPWTARGGS